MCVDENSDEFNRQGERNSEYVRIGETSVYVRVGRVHTEQAALASIKSRHQTNVLFNTFCIHAKKGSLRPGISKTNICARFCAGVMRADSENARPCLR